MPTEALIYQSNLETSTQKSLYDKGHVRFMKHFISWQSQRKSDRALRNVAAENPHGLNITLLNILMAAPLDFVTLIGVKSPSCGCLEVF